MLIGNINSLGITSKVKRVVVKDTFNRVNNNTTLGTADTNQNWQSLSGVWGIADNKVKLITSSGVRDYIVIDSGVFDCEIQISMVQYLAYARLAFRVTDLSNMFFLTADYDSAYRLYKLSAGTTTLLGVFNTKASHGDIMKVRLEGTSITVLINGNEVMRVNDSFNQKATKHGFGGVGSNFIFDDFLVVT